MYNTTLNVNFSRTEAAISNIREKGATSAQRKWIQAHQGELADGEKAPSVTFFDRQLRKFEKNGSVENRVCFTLRP